MVWTAPYGIDCARMRLSRSHTREPSVSEIIRMGYVEVYFRPAWRRRRGTDRAAQAAEPEGDAGVFCQVAADACGDRGLWGFALLGARAGKAGPRGETDCAAVGEAVCRAQPERRPRCPGAVPGGGPAT